MAWHAWWKGKWQYSIENTTCPNGRRKKNSRHDQDHILVAVMSGGVVACAYAHSNANTVMAGMWEGCVLTIDNSRKRWCVGGCVTVRLGSIAPIMPIGHLPLMTDLCLSWVPQEDNDKHGEEEKLYEQKRIPQWENSQPVEEQTSGMGDRNRPACEQNPRQDNSNLLTLLCVRSKPQHMDHCDRQWKDFRKKDFLLA